MTEALSNLPRTVTPRVWTYDEMVAELPRTNLPVELWNGEIIMSPAPPPGHQRIVRGFFLLLHGLVTQRGLGEVLFSPCDVVLTQKRVVQPDVLFISKARIGIVKSYIDGVPDLAMEVVSEGSWHRDRIEKKSLYEQAGLPEYWIVDPDGQTIEVLALIQGVFQLHSKGVANQPATSRLLPGFGVSFEQLLR